MNSNLARSVCLGPPKFSARSIRLARTLLSARSVCLAAGLAIGLAALGLQSGCASHGKRGGEGAEINPSVKGRPSFANTPSGYRVSLHVHVEQMEPLVESGHTWTVRVWTSTSDSDVVTPQQLDSILMQPWRASRPTLSATKREVDVDTVEYGVPTNPDYYIVVVKAIEMTQDEIPEVYAEATYVKAFDNGGTYPKSVEIPPYSETVSARPGADARQSASPGQAVRPVNPSIAGRPNFGTARVVFDRQHPLYVGGKREKGSTVEATVWGGYVAALPPDPQSVSATGMVNMGTGVDVGQSADEFLITITQGTEINLQTTGKYFRIHVEVVEKDSKGKVIDTAQLDHWFPTPNAGKPSHP